MLWGRVWDHIKVLERLIKDWETTFDKFIKVTDAVQGDFGTECAVVRVTTY